MSKHEFIDSLRRYLTGEVPDTEVQNNIKFYSDYLSSPTEDEELTKVASVGDPRLIAMNIIETYKMSHKIPHGTEAKSFEEQYEEVYEDGRRSNESNGRVKAGSFKRKLMGILSVVILIVVVVLLLKALSFALRLFLPFLVVFFLVFLFVGIFKR